MKVLVTGGGGFIGSHLVESQLAQGYLVRTIDLHVNRLAPVASHPNLEIVKGDLTNGDLVKRVVKGVDIIYHLASAHLDVTLSDAYYRQVNVDATLYLMQAANDGGVQRMIHCSTNGVVGEINNPPVDETVVCYPTNIYEQTKLEGERIALKYYAETGFPIVVVRPAWVYGPRCPRTSRLMRMVGKGRFIMFGSGGTLRHPIYISDMVKAFDLCSQSKQAPGQIFFIAGEKPVTIEHLVRLMAEVQEVPLRIVHLPLKFGQIAGSAIQFIYKPLRKQPPFSARSLDFYTKDNAYDISKARRELGFHPEINLQMGLKETLTAN